MLNIESLQVDPHLTRFIEDLRVQLAPAAAASSMQTTESESGGDGDAAPEAARAASESTSVTSMSEDDLRVVLDASEEELREPEDGWLLPPQAPEHAVRGVARARASKAEPAAPRVARARPLRLPANPSAALFLPHA